MNKNFLYLSLLTLVLVACRESQPTKEVIIDQIAESNQVIETAIEAVEDVVEEVAKIDFSKFDHYGTVLTKTDLIAKFGGENIVDNTSWYGEGSIEKQSSAATNPDNGHIVKFIWGDDKVTTGWIESSYYNWGSDYEIKAHQLIETENGLRLGMSLADLVVWNEADFEYSGFGWDFAGGIKREEGSKITNSNILLTLMDDQDIKDSKWDFMIGDVTLKNEDKYLKDAPVLIEQMTLFIDNE